MAVPMNDAVREAFTAGHLAHLVTLNVDGSPHVTVVWVDVDGDEIVSAHLGRHQKVRNIERNPYVALSMVTGGRLPNGLEEYLVVNGTARVTEGGAADLLRRLAPRYRGGETLPLPDDPPPGYIARITPERIGGLGPWAG